MAKKYIDADKLIAEIDNIYSEALFEYKLTKSRYSEGALGVTHRISSIIDSLRQEQPETRVSDDLEEAAKQFVGYDMDRDDLRDYEIGIAAFKAGAKWLAGQGLTQVCRVKADYDSHGADYGVRFLRIDLPDDTPVGEEIIVKIIPKTW